MDSLDDDTVSLLSKRVYDVAATLKDVRVFLNNKLIQTNVSNKPSSFSTASSKPWLNTIVKYSNHSFLFQSFETYIELYTPVKCYFSRPNEDWEVGIVCSSDGFVQVSRLKF